MGSIRITRRRRYVCALFVVLLIAASSRSADAAEFVHPTEHYRLTYPDDWFVLQGVLNTGGPLQVSSVPIEKYRHGGILPPGAAEITVQVFPGDRDEKSVLENLRVEPGAVRGSYASKGRKGERLQFTFNDGSDLKPSPTTEVAVATKVGGRVFLAQLEYPDAGAVPAKWEEILASIIASIESTGKE